MGIIGDVVKSFFKLALSDGVADDKYRVALEHASKHYINAIEYHSEAEFKKVFDILGSLATSKATDPAAILDRYQLLIQSHLKLAEFALESLQQDVTKALNSAQTPDEEKPVKVLQSELHTVEQHLEAAQMKREFLMRQPYSVKNDAEVKEIKAKIEQLSARKESLEGSILMTQSRGAEQRVMKSAYEKKVTVALRIALEKLVELKDVEDLNERLQNRRTLFMRDAKLTIEELNKGLKEIVEG